MATVLHPPVARPIVSDSSAPTRPALVPHYDPKGRTVSYRIGVLTVVVLPFLGLLFAMWQLWDRAVGWRDVALLVGLYIPISLGVTAGYHRMLTHRSFEAHPVVKCVLLALGSMSIEGSAIGWAANHTQHHLFSDKPGDPHTPTEGLWRAHVGWLFDGRVADPAFYTKALLEDPIVCFFDRTFLLWVGLSFLIPFLLGGWQGLIWGGLVRMFFVHHVTWSVNSVCHTWGSRPYTTTDLSRNNWVVGLLAMGEGWHNNHHRWPKAAVHGMDRGQFDASALLIRGLEKLGLVTQVYRISAAARRRG